MNEALILPVICILAGSFFVVRNVLHMTNGARLRRYLSTSPKARLLVNKYGVEETAAISRKYLLPIGVLVGLIILLVGLRALFVIFSA
ncbi:hypothetical protein GCM10007894_25260 [Paraferrimonas haliotis]|uniref:Uncharacterized protein n=1 Tax=Paraferrimonas haliotis TaxID=2013866 RepID=A0AA37TWX8_9GAMM|nr:hypothetical protein GCM10007894_25260 [Paraferrimonas haliotis]